MACGTLKNIYIFQASNISSKRKRRNKPSEHSKNSKLLGIGRPLLDKRGRASGQIWVQAHRGSSMIAVVPFISGFAFSPQPTCTNPEMRSVVCFARSLMELVLCCGLSGTGRRKPCSMQPTHCIPVGAADDKQMNKLADRANQHEQPGSCKCCENESSRQARASRGGSQGRPLGAQT